MTPAAREYQRGDDEHGRTDDESSATHDPLLDATRPAQANTSAARMCARCRAIGRDPRFQVACSKTGPIALERVIQSPLRCTLSHPPHRTCSRCRVERRDRILIAAIVVTLISAAVSTAALAQSPSPVLPSPSESVSASAEPSPAAPSASAAPSPSAASSLGPNLSPAPSPVGPIAWRRVTKGKDFTKAPSVYQVAQLSDGRVMVVGNIAHAPGFMGQTTGAAWVSSDGAKWSRSSLKAPKGSYLTAVAQGVPTAVIAGTAADGSGLLWTSADGSAWASVTPPSGVMYEIAATDQGF